MKAIVNSSARGLVVLVAILSWLAISNHCALALAVPRENIAENNCPYHSHPAKPAKQKESTEQPCCKILRALTPSLTKNPGPAIVDLGHVDVSFAKLITVPPPKVSFHLVASDTGPPGTTSFVELIGSMRAHAPPSLA
jgi:hypothetical protein